MRRTQTFDHLAHALTDLMISLMVIFILLVIVFVSIQQPDVHPSAMPATQALRSQLTAAGLDPSEVTIDPAFPYTLTVRLPPELRFGRNESRLAPAAALILSREMPKLAKAVCAQGVRGKVQSVTIEGYADATPFRGLTPGESRMRNLELSQARSREVVRRSLDILSSDPVMVECLADRVAASGRGINAGPAAAEASRRVVFRLSLDPNAAMDYNREVPPPAVTKMLQLFEALRTPSNGPVRFDVSEGEVNEYLQYALATKPRFGIQKGTLQFDEQNQISLRVDVSEEALDRLPGIGRFVADRVIGGRSLDLTVRLNVKDSNMTYSVVESHLGGLKLPDRLVREAIRFIAARQPEHYDTEHPIPLPFGLCHLETHRGRVRGDK